MTVLQKYSFRKITFICLFYLISIFFSNLAYCNNFNKTAICLDLFFSFSDSVNSSGLKNQVLQSKPDNIYANAQQLDFQHASNYLSQIVQSQKTFTFEQAIKYVLLVLPEGEIKDEFISSLYENVIIKNNVAIKEMPVLKSLMGMKSKIVYEFQFFGFLTDLSLSAKKIIWNAKKVHSTEEALERIFEAIHLVIEPEFKPILFATVYKTNKYDYMSEFFAKAKKLLVLQYEVYTVAKKFHPEIKLNKYSDIKMALKKLKRIVLSLAWFKQYRTIRDLELSQDIVYSIEHNNTSELDNLLRKKYSIEIATQWYFKYLRNINKLLIISIATLFSSSAVIFSPSLIDSLIYQYNLEAAQSDCINSVAIDSAHNIIKKSNKASTDRILEILKKVDKNNPGNLTPSEIQFLNEVKQAMSADLTIDENDDDDDDSHSTYFVIP